MKSYKVERNKDDSIKDPSKRHFLKTFIKLGLGGTAYKLIAPYIPIEVISKKDYDTEAYVKDLIDSSEDGNIYEIIKNDPHIKEIWDKLHPNETKDLEQKIFNEFNDKITEPRHTFEGRYLRTKRWENKIRETEEKYGIPKHYLFALIMQESYGDPLIVNERDGGSGLGCVQPKIADHYGLNTYKNVDFMISGNFGKELVKLVKEYNWDLDKLKKIHEPFDPDKCIEAMGNFLSDLYKELGDWEKAIAAYNCGPGDVIKGILPSITKKHVEDINGFKEILNLRERLE